MFNTSLIFLLDLVCVCVRFSKNKMLYLYYLVNNNIFLIFFFVIKKKIAIYLVVMKRDRVSKSLWETLL